MNRRGAFAVCLLAILATQPVSASVQLRQARSAVVQVLAQTSRAGAVQLQVQVQTSEGTQVLQLRPNRTLGVLATRLQGKATAYRGEIIGLVGSWVAVTRIGQRWTGIWFDGAHYFGIDNARSLANISSEAARGAPDRHLTFRLADLATDASFEGDTRVPNAEVMAQRIDGELSQPMRAEAIVMAAAVLPTKRLSVALIADAELAAVDGGQTQANLLARLNIVDGIFASQVGVHLQSSSVTVMTAGTQPFNTTVPEDLLTQLSNYRSGSSQQRAAGLSHLFTGRNLDGRTVGIAYISGLCSSTFSSSLSEAGNRSTQFSALIAAHEIGHVFGAPHDGPPQNGEAPSACKDEPTTFLMAPQLNGSSTFSSCSLDQIAPVVAQASCLAPYDAADGTIDAPAEAPVALGVPTDVSVTVQSVGTATLTGASLRIAAPSSVMLQSASGEMASCNIAGQIANCALGDLAPGTTRAVTFRVLAQTAGTPNVQLRVIATNDGLATNNTHDLRLRIALGADLALSGTLDRSTVQVGENISAVLTLQNRGPADATDARITVTLPAGLTLLSQSGEGVACAPVTAGVTCGPQLLISGGTMSATLTLRAGATGNLAISSQASASAPELLATDNQLQQTVTVNAVPPPAGNGTTGGGSSGGGGGALSALALGALAALAALSATRRQRDAAAK
jgi:uncharacterized repeat protein (TIGR01451 family)